MTAKIQSPKALMLLSGSCAHCPSVLDSLSKMIKKGDIGSLEVINLEETPDAMQEYNVRSVPWVKIGKHVLTGAQTLDALKQRAQWAKDEQDNDTNAVADFDFLLSDGQVNTVIDSIKKDDTGMTTVMSLLGDKGTVLSTRIGIGVVFEEFAQTPLIQSLTAQLGKLTKSEDSRIRADAYHYLGMTNDKSAIPFLEAGKKDEDAEIREIASDSLDEILTNKAS